jgi:hypothetical protein
MVNKFSEAPMILHFDVVNAKTALINIINRRILQNAFIHLGVYLGNIKILLSATSFLLITCGDYLPRCKVYWKGFEIIPSQIF